MGLELTELVNLNDEVEYAIYPIMLHLKQKFYY